MITGKPIKINVKNKIIKHAILVEEGGQSKIYRRVKAKDKMYKHDAWSLNPKVFDEYKDKATGIIWEDDKNFYMIKMDKAIECEIRETYAGGETCYFPEENMDVIDKESWYQAGKLFEGDNNYKPTNEII